jgi:hypothetical protein
MRVLSIDPGLRNLAIAVVDAKSGWEWPDEFRVPGPTPETAEQFRHRALQEFLGHAWSLSYLQVIDVSRTLDRKVTNIKRMPMADKVRAIVQTLDEVQADVFPSEDLHPTAVVVEVQHNANPEMKAVGTAALALLCKALPGAELRAITGVHKLKLCDALGFPEGSGLACKRGHVESTKQMPASRRKTGDVHVHDVHEDEPGDVSESDAEEAQALNKRGFRKVGGKWIRTKQGCLDKYYDNKHRSMLALKKLLPAYTTPKGVKMDDVADALLQGLWILWEAMEPPRPKPKPKPRARATVRPDSKLEPEPEPEPQIKTSVKGSGLDSGTSLAPDMSTKSKSKATRSTFSVSDGAMSAQARVKRLKVKKSAKAPAQCYVDVPINVPVTVPIPTPVLVSVDCDLTLE